MCPNFFALKLNVDPQPGHGSIMLGSVPRDLLLLRQLGEIFAMVAIPVTIATEVLGNVHPVAARNQAQARNLGQRLLNITVLRRIAIILFLFL